MKKNVLYLCALLFLPTFARDKPGVQQSKTFMWTRPAFLSVAADQALWHDFMYNKPSKGGNSIQVKSIYQKSLSKERIKQYFMFGCKNELLVAGDNAPLKECRDVRAEWLCINSDFYGRMTLNPERREAGFSITFHKDLSTLSDMSFFQDYWMSIELPFFAVRNSLNLEQFDVIPNLVANKNTPTDIISAFNQKKWLYSKIPSERNNVSLIGLLARFGRAYLSEDHFKVVYYSVFNIPFGDGQNPAYLFDAYSGTNQHFGFGAGANFQVLLNKDASRYALCWFLNLEHLFMSRNKQLRTFDLKNKPWSRYMLYNRKECPSLHNIPGVNILTFNTRVRPYSFVDFSTGWRLITDQLELEIGYDLWGHGDERVKILCDFEDVYGIAGTMPGTSASKSTIAHQAPNDTTFTPIKETDIDLSSAEAQSSLNHKFHASVGYTKMGTTADGFFGIGGAMEWPQKNSALHVWTLWLKCGVSH